MSVLPSLVPLLSSQDREPLGHLRVQVAGSQQDEGARLEQPLPPEQDHGPRLRAQEVREHGAWSSDFCILALFQADLWPNIYLILWNLSRTTTFLRLSVSPVLKITWLFLEES